MTYRFLLIAGSLVALALIYIFQRVDYVNFITGIFGGAPSINPTVAFIINKTLRLVLNDLLSFLLIFALFREKKYMRIAFFVFCFELVVLLPVYFVIKLKVEGVSEISSPLLSQVHRLIVNPLLMVMLIVAFYYQRYWSHKG